MPGGVIVWPIKFLFLNNKHYFGVNIIIGRGRSEKSSIFVRDSGIFKSNTCNELTLFLAKNLRQVTTYLTITELCQMNSH